MRKAWIEALDRRIRELSAKYDVTLPVLDETFLVYDLSNPDDVRSVAAQFNFEASGGFGTNYLVIHRNTERFHEKTPMELTGGENIVVIGEDCRFHGKLRLDLGDNLAVINGGQPILAMDAHLSNGGTLLCGRSSSAWGLRTWAQDGTVLSIGDGCLMSENISIRTTDHHSIIDLDTWEQLNFPSDVVIGRHVWLGASVTVGKGVNIGDGAIVAQHSTLTKSIPAREVWGGYPARMIRQNVSWTLSHPADETDLGRLKQLFGKKS